MTSTTTTKSRPLLSHYFDLNTSTLPLGVPGKFLPSGLVQPYPGNTTICHIPPYSPILPVLQKVYDTYANHSLLASYIRLLPPSSWHMTILDGVREYECEPGMWPSDTPKEPLPVATETFGRRLREAGMKLDGEGLGAPYRVKMVGFEPSQCGMGLEIRGVDDAEEKRLRRLRDRLAECLGVRAPNHEVYGFHVTVGYLLKTLEGNSKKEMVEMVDRLMEETGEVEFELGSVEYCTFEDMDRFDRLFYLELKCFP